MSESRKTVKSVLTAALLISVIMLVVVSAAGIASAAENSAPEWTAGAVKEDEKTVTLGNPYTPIQSITAKWTDPDNDKLTYWYSLDDSEPALCSDYNGSEEQLPYFAYTFTSLGTHTLKIWVSDGKSESDPFVATVKVVDPDKYEYTMTINAAPKNVDLTFYKCEGFNENGEDIPGDEISYKSHSRGDDYHTYIIKLKAGTYSFRGRSTAGSDLGGMTFQVPNEAKTAGSSETTIYIKELDVGCATKYDDVNYCTEEHFRPHVTTYGHEAVYGDITASSGVTYYRTMVLASSNDITYQRYVEALDPATTYGYTDGGFGNNTTVSPGSAAQKLTMDLAKAREITLRTPEGSDARLFFQRNYYFAVDKTDKMLAEKTSNGDGTETWKFIGPVQFGIYTWRVSKEGRLTRAGYTNTINGELDLTDEDPCSPDSKVTTAGDGYIDNSILLNVNSSNVLDLGVGEEFTLRPFRAWQIIDDPGSNCIIEPDFHTDIVRGQDLLEIQEDRLGNASGNRVRLIAKKEGIAVLKVSYDAMRIYSNSDGGVYGACDAGREGYLIVRIGGSNTDRVFFGLSGSVKRNTQWDADFDTCYFQGEQGELYMTPISDSGISSVGIADPEEFSFTEIEEQDGRYIVPVRQGSSVVRIITESGEEHYQIVKGCRYSYKLTNMTREDQDPVAGDTVKLHLNGLYMPVPKMAGVYNPGFENTGKVNYTTEDGKKIQSAGSQYTFIASQDITVTIPGYSGGEYVLGDGQMSFSIMAAPNCLGIHRDIPEGGLNTMFNAVSNGWKGSALGDLTVPVGKTGHGLIFTGAVEGSEIELTNAAGTEFIYDASDEEGVSYPELPEDTYTYTITHDKYGEVSGEAVITAEDSGLRQIAVEQKLNDQDVQDVIDRINALPDADSLKKEDVDDVNTAKAMFDALSEAQQALIPRAVKDKLEQLVNEAMILSDDDVMNVIGLIKGLPDAQDLTIEDRSSVDEAEQAYNSLTDDQKVLVGENLKARLDTIVRRMAVLIADKENQDAADQAEQYIKALPETDALTLDDKDAVDQAKSYYDNLTRVQKALVSDSCKLILQDAVNRIRELEEQAEQDRLDKEAAEAAEQLITELPVLDAITLEDKEKIEEVKAKYESLTDAQKALVSDNILQLLQNALNRIDELEEQARQAEEQARQDKEAAEAAEQLITELPALDAITLDDKEKIEEAKAKYDSLTDVQKALVSDNTRQMLQNALNRIDELEEQARQAEEQARQDKAASEAAEQLILKLPALDALALADKDAVVQARACFDSLTDFQKTLVPYEIQAVLLSAESRIKELERIRLARSYKVKIRGKALKGHKARIRWNKVSGVTGYKVFRATKKKGRYKLIRTLKNPKKVSFINRKLKKGKYYYYKVKPYTRISGTVYTGKWSNRVSVKAK